MVPVDDIPVHEKVKHQAWPAGCKNGPPCADGYWALDRNYLPNGQWTYRQVYVPHAMSTKCRQILPLPECEGCTAEKDVEYISKWATTV